MQTVASHLNCSLYVCNVFLHLDTDIDLYADDTINHCAGKTTDVIEPKLQVSTCDFNTWCTDNNMGVHYGKTHAFVAGSKHMTSANRSIAVSIHEHTIECQFTKASWNNN